MWRTSDILTRILALPALLSNCVDWLSRSHASDADRVDSIVCSDNGSSSLGFVKRATSATASALVSLAVLVSGIGISHSATVIINFETSPGPDDILGTADDIATPTPCVACRYLSQLGYEAVGVNFTSGTLFAGSLFPDAAPTNHYSSSTVPDATFSTRVYAVRLRSYSFWTVTLYALDDADSIIATDTSGNSSQTFQLAELKVSSDRPISRFTVRPEGCSPSAPTCDRIVNIDDLTIYVARPMAGTLSYNPAGVGQFLIVPYFSAQGGNATLISIVNTDEARGKALKVRFRGASNADAIFDFQVFLAPGDVWSANIGRGPNGLSRMATADRSCTLPASINRDFVTERLNPGLSSDELASETREGYVEIINMGDILPSTQATSLWQAIVPDENGIARCTASVLESLVVGDARLAPPTTGLTANWTIINVPGTTIWSGTALAVEARSQGLATEGRNVYWPQTSTALTAEQIAANSADPLFRLGKGAAASHDLPDLSTPYVPDATAPLVQAAVLSDALAATVVAAEYTTDETINASTDWIVSMPTRRYYAAVDYAGATRGEQLITNYNQFGLALADYFRSRLPAPGQVVAGDFTGNLAMGSSASGCPAWQSVVVLTSLRFWNREGVSPTPTSPIGTPAPLPPPVLCGAVSALGIKSPASPVGATITRINVTPPGPTAAGWFYYPDVPLIDGWGRITALNRLTVDPFEGLNLGLPMLVTQFSKAFNPQVVPDVSGTFGGVWKARVMQRGAFHSR